MAPPVQERTITVQPDEDVVSWAIQRAMADGRPGDFEDYLLERLVLTVEWEVEDAPPEDEFLRCTA